MYFYWKCSWHFDDIFKVLPLRKFVHGILLRNSKWWDQGPFIYNKGYKPIFPSPHQNIRDDGNKNICYFWTCAYWNMLWWIVSKLLSKTKRPVLSNLWIISCSMITFTIFNDFWRTESSINYVLLTKALEYKVGSYGLLLKWYTQSTVRTPL